MSYARFKALSEKQIETQILTWLNHQPDVFAFKVNTTGIYDPTRKVFRTIQNPFHHRGTADIIGVKSGRFFALEVKTPQAMKRIAKPGTKLTPRDLNQSSFLKKCNDCQGRARRVSSLTEAIDFMRDI